MPADMSALQDLTLAIQVALDDQAAAMDAMDVARDRLISLAEQLKAIADNQTATGPVPAGATVVRVGTSSYPLAGGPNPTKDTNPAGYPYPGCRGKDQAVAWQAVASLTTNGYGCVATIGADGVVVATHDDEPAATPTTLVTTPVPAGGAVLAFHGLARAWALDHVQDGVKVEFTPAPAPVPSPQPHPQPANISRTIGVYMMDGVGHISQIQPECNRILVAFYQDSGLVEWGGDSPGKTAADLSTWHASRAGNEVVISLGGQGGAVALDSVAAGLAKVNRTMPVDGIDWDAEAFGYSPAQAVSVSQACAAAIGVAPKDFIVQFPPPGGDPVQPALDAAKACQDAGFRVSFGQQLYGTAINDSDVIDATDRAVKVLGAPSVLVGMMIGDPYNSWTIASAASRMEQVVAKWPTIGGIYAWESSREGNAQMVRAAATALGVS